MMDCRQDYYKFAHSLLPYTVFNYSNETIQKILDDKEKFIKELKKMWKRVEIDGDQVRSDPPSFDIEIKKVNSIYSLIIISLPEAENNRETSYIGILFDAEYSARYFTYEISDAADDINYLLCEWTWEWEHLSYGAYKKLSFDIFIKGIKDALYKENFSC